MDRKISDEVNSKIEQIDKIIDKDLDKAYEIAEEAYNLSLKNNLLLQQGMSLMSLCMIHRVKGQVAQCLKHAYKALEIFESIGAKDEKVKALNMISIAYYYSSVYDKAIQYLFESLTLCNDIGDSYMLTCILSNIGEIYRESKRFNESLEYNNQAYDICEEKNLDENIGYILKNMGKVYFDMGKFDDAMEYLTKSYNNAVEHKDFIEMGQVESQMGNVYVKLEDYEKAKSCYKESLKRFKNIKGGLYEVDALIGMGRISLKEKLDDAMTYFNEAIKYCSEINNDRKLSYIYSILADYYEESGEYKQALEYQKKHYNVHEKINAMMIGYKLEIIKFELAKLNMNSKIESFRIINEQLEDEIHSREEKVKELISLNDSLKEKANYDHLTGLANRHLINTYMNNLWTECSDKNQSIFIMIMDIDDFKRFNDHWGHAEGDECLKKVASALKEKNSSLKSLTGRYGGEEFIFFKKDITYEEALNIGESFRTRVSELNIRYNERKEENVTLSIGGVIGYTSDLRDIKTAIDMADKQLYISKNMGKNMVNIVSTTIHNYM